MSAINQEWTVAIPPLVDGDRLDRSTFHERYAAMPPETRAELIGGVVHMSSPVRTDHGDYVGLLTAWAAGYARGIDGLRVGCDSTLVLDERSEPQPDVHLRILPDHGGQTGIESGYIAGSPELVIEVAHSSRKIDLGPKFEDYRRTGVLEYVVVTSDPNEVYWFVRRDEALERMTPGTDGIYRSRQFPGLWLEPDALFDGDLERLFNTVERGRATPEFVEFAASMAARKRS